MDPAAAAPDPKRALFAPVSVLRDATPQRIEQLRRLGIETIRDLLFFFPRDYADLSDLRPIRQLEEDKVQTIRGTVREIDGSSSGFARSRVGVLVQDESDYLRAMWFNQPFMRDKFFVGQRVQMSARPRKKGGRWEMAHPNVVYLDAEETVPTGKLLAVYPLTEGLTQYYARRLIHAGLQQYGGMLDEVLSEHLLEEYDLAPLADALPAIHEPLDHAALNAARRRFTFQELFVLQLALAARRFQQRVSFKAPELPATAQIDARIRRLFPFELTAGQNAAIADVSQDIALDTPMNRLLQGDVGSGKTVVAVYALLCCVANGAQAALMAPTEILARQHAATLEKLLKQSRVEYRLLVGGLSTSEREEILRGLASGEIDLVIGTHALLQDSVEFKRLGLVVIDEQHKFGVRQRAALRRGDQSPHYLVMTATPIPRTLSMTQFGDLDVSILRDMPPGRQPISTYLVEPDQQARWWKFVRDKLAEGRQAYFVAPLVEESESVSAASVKAAFDELTHGELAGHKIELLHGRMSHAEKEVVMNRFRKGEVQVLVSTTVIEVGVDVANASVMIIASPERFGLSQLHQLRGRIGRGSHPGFCGLLAPAELSDVARQRLEAFGGTTDGFKIAELDFSMRGPGDLFGDKQSGLPPLWYANLVRDREVVEEARDAARKLYAADPGLKSPENHKLRKQMLQRYGEVLELGDVG